MIYREHYKLYIVVSNIHYINYINKIPYVVIYIWSHNLDCEIMFLDVNGVIFLGLDGLT